MNGLSWLLYWADVVDALNSAFAFMAGAAIVVLGATVAIGYGCKSEARQETRDVGVSMHKVSKQAALVAPLFMVLASLTPSKETVYAIAASEVGETALKSETGGKAVKALNAWLDRQIQPPKEDNAKQD